jgi:hypothetical protein
MYLAGILGLCALLPVSAWGQVSGDVSFVAATSQKSQQEPAKPEQSTSPSQQPEPANPEGPAKPQAAESQPEATQPAQEPSSSQSAQPSGSQSADSPSMQPVSPKTKTSPAKKKKPSTKKTAARKKHKQQASGEPQKRVVHRGSTAEPTAKLAPSITEEQAARQRDTTNKLLASTNASLQKLSGRQLTNDEQETVVQIRKFMEQVKAADSAGDLQRAYKLAVKAHLLSDALAKP